MISLPPKNLRQAIRAAICIGPLKDMEDRVYSFVIAFLADQFLEMHRDVKTLEEAEMLKKLFKRMVGEE
jgi:hypothetical protein